MLLYSIKTHFHYQIQYVWKESISPTVLLIVKNLHQKSNP